MAESADWERLASLLDDDSAVPAAVRDAIEGGADPWEALLDGLDDAGALAYLQIDDTGMELADALAQLPRVVRVGPGLATVTDTDDLSEATALADTLLQQDGLRLIRLVEDDQSWPVVVTTAQDSDEIVELATRLGREAIAGG